MISKISKWLLVVTTFLGWPLMAVAEEEIVVEVEGVVGVAAYLEQIGFHDINNYPERLQSVPCTRISRIPDKPTKAWREQVQLRKSVFFRLGLSAVLQVNEQILAERQRLMDLSLDNLSTDDRAWLSATAVRYKVAEADDPLTTSQLEELMLRVDALPPSLVIVQGAIESGWFMSRFARTGQALFGQWTTSESGIKALGSDVRLAAFDNPRDSLIAYTLNINTNRAYSGLRNARAEMRSKGEPLDGHALAGYMRSYAETGEEYVELIRGMIRRDDLTRADTAELAQGSCILFRRVDQK